MFKNLFDFIKKILGIRNSQTTDSNISNNENYTARYECLEGVNLTSIFANSLANYVVSDSSVSLIGENKRADLLRKFVDDLWLNMKKISTRTFGIGGVLVVPYVSNGELLFNIVNQDRMIINKKQGNKIVDATILSDMYDISTNERYYKFNDYKIINNDLYIRFRVINKSGKQIETGIFGDLEDVIIPNVDRVPFAYFKCPVDNRKENSDFGVPITFGGESIIEEIKETLEQIRKEFKNKKVRVFADTTMFEYDSNGNPVCDKDFFTPMLDTSNKGLLDVFSPAIRETSYYTRLQNLFELLEKQVCTSKGILTENQSGHATATEIKAGMYQTYCIISDFRVNVERAVDDLMYVCNVLANYYNLTPMGDCDLVWDWSYGMVESTEETYRQLVDGNNNGHIADWEVRQFIKTGETIEESKKAIEEIKKNEPKITQLFGE